MARSHIDIVQAWHGTLWPIITKLSGLAVVIHETMLRGEARPAVLAVAMTLCAGVDASEVVRRLLAPSPATDE